MKRIIETTEDAGFDAMLGEKVQVWCGVFIYAGTLTGVNGDHIELTDASVVYETGALTEAGYADAQPVSGTWRVMKQSIESWGQGA